MKRALWVLALAVGIVGGFAIGAPSGTIPTALGVNGEWDFYDGIKTTNIGPVTGGTLVISGASFSTGTDAGFNAVTASYFNATPDGGFATGAQGWVSPKASGGDLVFYDAGSGILWEEGTANPAYIGENHTWNNGGCTTGYIQLGTTGQPYLTLGCTDGVARAIFGFGTTAASSLGPTTVTSLTSADGGFLNISAVDGGFQSLAVLGSTVATAANGQAGWTMTGVLVEADLVAAHADEIIGAQKLLHPINAGSANITLAITKAGTTGGTFNVFLKDTTTSQFICVDNGISCTTAAGVVQATCTLDAGNIGDAIEVHANTTSCTGNDPTVWVTIGG